MCPTEHTKFQFFLYFPKFIYNGYDIDFVLFLLPGQKTLFLDRYYFHRRVCVCLCVCVSVCESLYRLSQKVLDRF